MERIGVGEHAVSVRRAGMTVKRAELMDARGKPVREVPPLRDVPGAPRFPVQVTEGESVRIRFELETAPASP
jgi:hypothetical protein